MIFDSSILLFHTNHAQPDIEKRDKWRPEEMFRRNAGQTGPKTGRPDKNGTSGKPHCRVVVCDRCLLSILSYQLHVDPQSAIARSPLLAREH